MSKTHKPPFAPQEKRDIRCGNCGWWEYKKDVDWREIDGEMRAYGECTYEIPKELRDYVKSRVPEGCWIHVSRDRTWFGGSICTEEGKQSCPCWKLRTDGGKIV